MLRHVISAECAQMAPCIGATLANHLKNNLNEKFSGLEKVNSLSVATILDPRFKQAGFTNQSNAQAAVERPTQECALLLMRRQKMCHWRLQQHLPVLVNKITCGLYWTTM
ncbi:hypothetical protein D4764_08G0000920 [Takifugu flavidus]|uniref:Uncharacterized protein n=1 Tax=Takifugu flavidus TaxID=433684 RepID=A0A5C6MN26_9TELE|nr:hypothetical protein D4764_08G0000920 [Takifugu flavidus]